MCWWSHIILSLEGPWQSQSLVEGWMMSVRKRHVFRRHCSQDHQAEGDHVIWKPYSDHVVVEDRVESLVMMQSSPS